MMARLLGLLILVAGMGHVAQVVIGVTLAVSATPTDLPGMGSYFYQQTITLSTTTPGATICYTTDGSIPAATTPGTCSAGMTYSASFILSTTTTVHALATMAGFSNSAVLTSVYTITIPIFTRVQNQLSTLTNSGTTITLTLPAAPTVGNAVLCTIQWVPSGTVNVASVQDNAATPNTYAATPASPIRPPGTSSMAVGTFYLLTVPAGAGATITVTMSGALTFNSFLICAEFHRTAGTWAIDNDAAASNSTSATMSTPSFTPANVGELLFASMNGGSSFITAVSAPWTRNLASSTGNAVNAYILAAAPGSTSCAATLQAVPTSTNPSSCVVTGVK